MLVTPHVGFNTSEAIARILDETISNIAAWHAGRLRNRLDERMTRPNRPVSTVRLAGRPTQRSALRRATQIASGPERFLLWVAWHRGLMRCDTHRAAGTASPKCCSDWARPS
ncbi:hypothetical protein ACPA9J_03580 [Pseudomonas aeruginosa]